MGSSPYTLPPHLIQDPELRALLRSQQGARGFDVGEDGTPQPYATDPAAALVDELLARKERGELDTYTPSTTEAPAPSGSGGVLHSVIGGVDAVAGFQKRGVDALTRQALRALGGTPRPDATTGSLVREAVGLAPTPESGHLARLGGGALELGTDIVTDPVTWETAALGKVVGLGAKGVKLLEGARAAEMLTGPLGALTPEVVGLAEKAIARGARFTPYSRAASAGFAGLMGTGAVQGAQHLRDVYNREGFTPEATEAALHTAVGALGAGAAGFHAATLKTPRISPLLDEGLQKAVESGDLAPERAQQIGARAARDANPGAVQPPTGPTGPGGAPGGPTPGPGPVDPAQALADFEATIRGLPPGTPSSEDVARVQEAAAAAQDAGHPIEALQARLEELLNPPAEEAPAPPPPVQAAPPPPPAPAAVAAEPQGTPLAQIPVETRAVPKDRVQELMDAGMSRKHAQQQAIREATAVPGVAEAFGTVPVQEATKGKPKTKVAPAAPPTPVEPAPAAEAAPAEPTPAAPAQPTHRFIEQGRTAVGILKEQNVRFTEARFRTEMEKLGVKLPTGKHGAGDPKGYHALIARLVAEGELGRVPGKSGHLIYGPGRAVPEAVPAELPPAEEAVRLRRASEGKPEVTLQDEQFWEAVRKYTLNLLEQQRAALERGDHAKADELDVRIQKYLDAIETQRIGDTAPVLQSLVQDLNPSPTKPASPGGVARPPSFEQTVATPGLAERVAPPTLQLRPSPKAAARARAGRAKVASGRAVALGEERVAEGRVVGPGEAAFLDRVQSGTPSEGPLRRTTDRPFTPDPEVPRETPEERLALEAEFGDRQPSPALYMGRPLSEATIKLDDARVEQLRKAYEANGFTPEDAQAAAEQQTLKEGRYEHRVTGGKGSTGGYELLPNRAITEVEAQKLGTALGGIGFDLREQAKSDLRAETGDGRSRNKRLVAWNRARLDADALAKFNAAVAAHAKATSKADVQAALDYYDGLEATYLKERPKELLRAYGSPGFAIKTAYDPKSPAGKVSRQATTLLKTSRAGFSGEDALQDSLRGLIRRYINGDPEVQRIIDTLSGTEQANELTALLRTAEKRGTRKGLVKGEVVEGEGEVYTPREQGLGALTVQRGAPSVDRRGKAGTSSSIEPRLPSPDAEVDRADLEGDAALRTLEYWKWNVREAKRGGTGEVGGADLPKEGARIIRRWYEANLGFERNPETKRLTATGRTQLGAAIRRLGEVAQAAKSVPQLRNEVLARLSNLVGSHHWEFKDNPHSRPWKKLEADLRIDYGMPPDKVKGKFEEVARRITGLDPIEWRKLRAEVFRSETRGQAAGEAAPRETGPSEIPFEESRRTTPSTPEWRLGPEQKAARAAQFAEAERSRSTPVEGHPDLVIVDYDGSGVHPLEMDAIQAYGQRASEALRALHQRLAAHLGREYDFRGYTPSPAREGVFYKGAMHNPLYHLADALEDARRIGGENDPGLVAAFATNRAAWTATHEGLHSALRHGDAVAEEAFASALSELRKAVREDPEYMAALDQLQQAVDADVVERARKAMPVFEEKVREADRAIDSGTGVERNEGVLDRSGAVGDQGRRGPGRDPGNLARGPGGGVRADSTLPGGLGEAVSRRDREGTPLGRGLAQDAGTSQAAGGARAAVGRGDAAGLRDIPDEEAARIVAEHSRPQGDWVENPTPENVAKMMQPYAEEALRLGPGKAVSNAIGRAIGLGPDDTPDQLSTRKIKLVLGNGPIASKDPRVHALQEAILVGMKKGPQADDAIIAQSRPAHGVKPLQPGELDVAYNFTKLYAAGSEHARAVVARALHDTDPSLKGKPIRMRDVDAEVQRMLQVQDVDQAVEELHRRGIKDLYDLSLVRRVTSDGLRELDQRRAEMVAAAQRGDLRGLQQAEQALTMAGMRTAIALRTGAIGSTNAARMMAMLRHESQLSEPLHPQEVFAGKFRGALRQFGLTTDQAAEVHQAMLDSIQSGDMNHFNTVFNAAFAPKDFRGRLRQILTYWKANMMGAPTQFANLAGNASFKLILRDAEHVVAAGLEALFKGAKRERYVSEAKVAWMARRKAFGGAFRDLHRDVVDLLTLQPPDLERLSGRSTSRLDPVDVRALEDVTKGKAHQFLMQPLKLMSAVDRFFQTLNRSEYLHRQAYRSARKAGHKGTAAHAEMDRIVGEMEQGFRDPLGVQDVANRELAKKWDKELTYATEEAERDVFQGKYKRDVFGVSGKALDEWSSAMPLLDLLIPFKKTPINVAKEAWRRLPVVGFFSALKDLREGTKSGRALDNPHFFDEIAKPILGSAIMASVVMAALEGDLLTGQGPTDPFAQQTLKKSGWQPYSFKIGNAYIPFSRFEPLATILGIAADIAEARKRGDTATVKEHIERGISSVQQNLTNKTFLQGLESFFTFWSDPLRAGAGTQFIKQFVMSAVPNTIGWVPFGTAAKAIDPVYRETTIFSAPASKVPFLSKALPPQYDTFGDIRTREGSPLTRALLPVQITHEQGSAAARVAREIDKIGMHVQRPKTYVRGKGGRYDYTEEDQALLAEAQQRGVLAVDRLLESPGYQQLPDNELDPRAALGVDTKEAMIRKVLMQYRSPVMNMVNARANRALATTALTTLRGTR